MEPEDDVVKSDCCCCGENLNSRALVQQESGLRVPIAPMSLWSTPSQMSGIKPTKPEGDHDDDDPFLTTTLHHMAIKLGCFKVITTTFLPVINYQYS